MAENSSSERISQKSDPGSERGGSGKNKGLIIAGVAVGIVIIVLVGIIIKLTKTQNDLPEQGVVQQQTEEKRNVVVTPDNVDEVIGQMNENSESYVEPGYYTVTMNYNWHFSDGNAESDNAYVENAIENTNAVYFDIVLGEDEEHVIYKSPVLPVGSHLENIALDEQLDSGDYDCVIVYHLVDDEQSTISTLRLTMTITIDN